MSFTPGFNEDVFISYSTIDNQPLTEGQKGWISNFHRALRIRLGQILGEEPVLWRDEQGLQGNTYYESEILTKVANSAILVSVVSPRYLKSEWCRREIAEFFQRAGGSGGVRIQNSSRIFKVIKTPVERNSQPPEMQGLLSYDFFIEDDDKKVHEFDPELGPEAKNRYLAKLNDLAYDISNQLKALQGTRQVSTPSVSIYLAETTADLRDVRDTIRRDLLQRNIAVLPDCALSTDAVEFKKQVSDFLARSAFSVHLVGQKYGFVPEGETLSNIWLQHNLAVEHSKNSSFSRLIWMPKDLETTDPRQQQLVDFLLNDPASQNGAELLQSQVKDIKIAIDDKLSAVTVKPKSVPPVTIRIYVICDPHDLEGDALAPLENFLFDSGFEPIFSYSGADEARSLDYHLEQLRLCQALLIYYGKGDELWLRTNMDDARKILATRDEPFWASAICIAPPDTDRKRRFQTREALVFRASDSFSPAALTPFIDALRQTEKAGRPQ
jgi:hypothetical protein